MSHEMTADSAYVTVNEWVYRLMNEFHELRVGFTDVMKMKLTEFFTTTDAFVSTYHSELLYTSLSIFMMLIFATLLNRALMAEKALEKRSQHANFLEEMLGDERDEKDLFQNWLKESESEIEELKLQLADTRIGFDIMRDEFQEKLDDVRTQRDEIQTEFDSMERDRDYWESEANSWRSYAHSYEAERDEAQEELENIKQATPQLAYAA